MSKVVVYLINDKREAIEFFECEREFAMQEYFGKKIPQGRYIIANISDKIKYPIKRKQRKNIMYHSSQEK